MIKLGEKIKTLRKQKNISQEVLANYLGVSFQSVSKWETEATMPDVTLIPAIASFFDVSTDELFDYNRAETERKVNAICGEAYKYRESDPAKSEEILRDGLKQFPGNDLILVNLLHVIYEPERADEVINTCKSLLMCTREDGMRYSALFFMANAYKELGEYTLVKETVEQIPEIYFSKLSLAASLYKGDERFEYAGKLQSLSFEDLLYACRALSKCYSSRGELEKAHNELDMAVKFIEVLLSHGGTEYVKKLYETYSGYLAELESEMAGFEKS